MNYINASEVLSYRSAFLNCVTTGGYQKLQFGSGIKLFIHDDGEDYQPSFYKLSNGNISACLATDFSRNKAAATKEKAVFNGTDAVQIKGDSLYNQVALLSPEDEEHECDLDEDVCEETLHPDPKVNLMSLTILGLRLLFFKTVVFNVLMTLRLWISQ
ncbi:T cell receptor alpha chain MC.7.G5 [Cebidichthys violaceus]|uniref:T cell receptor alpha chain MC.7.G5 n=1 Tax=Cebidichthys violaceus TaxID=271503 RepID=UPI0035CB3C57